MILSTKTITCDKCDKKVTIELDAFGASCHWSHFAHSHILPDHMMRQGGGTWVDLDLCEDCTRAMYNFLFPEEVDA